MKKKAKKDIKTIVLPEGNDIRTLQAVEKVRKEGFADVIVLGEKEEIINLAKENNIDIDGVKIITPVLDNKYEELVNEFYELRKLKGMTPEKARETLKDETYYGMMMVKLGDADGIVSGAIHSTSDTLRPALQILKTAPGTKLVSAFFLMVVPNCNFGEEGIFVFGDCGLNQNPTPEELARIKYNESATYTKVGDTNLYPILVYSTTCYVKTADGWKLAIPFVKTSDGWKQAISYVKTSDGWKL